MAAWKSKVPNYLKCTFCSELYVKPCTLICNHSFCGKCLEKHLETRKDAIKAKVIPCPSCDQITPVPNPAQSVYKWIGQLKPSEILVDVWETWKRLNDVKENCFMCEKSISIAWCTVCEIYLCERCTRMHKIADVLKEHQLVDWALRALYEWKCKAYCDKHEENKLLYICSKCDKTLCIDGRGDHKGCGEVVEIIDTLPEKRDYMSDRRDYFKEQMKVNMEIAKKEKVVVERTEANEKRAKQKIETTADVLVTLIRRREKQLLDDIDKTCRTEIGKHKSIADSTEINAQMYELYAAFIDEALSSELKIAVHLRHDICRLQAVEHSSLKKPGSYVIHPFCEIMFTPNINPIRAAIEELGRIDTNYSEGQIVEEPIQEEKKPVVLSSPVLHATLELKHPSDEHTPDPIDIAVLEEDDLVVVGDYANACFKSVCMTNERKILSVLELEGRPLQVSRILGKKVISNLDDGSIVIVEVRATEMVIINTVTMKGHIWGLTALASCLFAGGKINAGIEVFDTSGSITATYNSDTQGLEDLNNPHYLSCTHGGEILISDRSSRAIFCLNITEIPVTFTYKIEQEGAKFRPGGVTSNNKEDVFFAQAERIVQLSPKGEFVKIILTSSDGIVNPAGLGMDERNRLYVCQRDGSNCVKVFRLP